MSIYRLEPGVQHYAWGDTRFIPELLGVDNSEAEPFAELWLGTHSDLPSYVEVDGERVPLNDVVDGDLPYLLKVLSAAKPLSIQAHPSEAQAREGFRRENADGVAIDAPHRNYKDAHHKPELLCALTDFYALRGFRPEPPPFEGSSLKAMYESLMRLPQSEVDARLAPKVEALRGGSYGKGDREYWVLRCHEEFSQEGHYDRGLFSVFLLNLIHLKPGEAIYLDAGILHAYLEGSGIEIMANSNNVLRGGLTRKHVDVDELLKTVLFESEEARIVQAEATSGSESRYGTSAREFELRRIVTPHQNDAHHGPEILLVVEGEARVGPHLVHRGEALFVSAGEAYDVDGKAALYKATVPE